jgi:hypothetical protein
MGRASRLKKEKRKLLEFIAEVQLPRPIQTDRKRTWRSIPLLGRAMITLAVALFGAWVGYVQTVRPRILIEPPSQLVDPQDPYISPFIVTNDGYLTVYNLMLDCAPASVAVTGLQPASDTAPWDVGGWARGRVLNQDFLVPTDPKPFVCDTFRGISTKNVKIVGVDVLVTATVSLLPYLNWPSYSKSILFEADSDGTSKFRWHELAIGEQPHFPKSSMQMQLVPAGKGKVQMRAQWK